MFRVVKGWRIILYFDLSDKSITFVINDDHYSNMIRKLGEIDFDFDPTKIEISEIKQQTHTAGTFVEVKK